MNLTTPYMGLLLHSPLVASASPLTSELPKLLALQDAGAGAVVLPSLFAEQLEAQARRDEALSGAGAHNSPEAASYLPAPARHQLQAVQYIDLVRDASRQLAIPVIASLNGASVGSWVNYARQLEDAGAAALELNMYFVAADLSLDGRAVEQRYLDIVAAVRQRVRIPLAVKLSPYFSAPGHFAIELAGAGADALVLFNRFYQPDIDTVRLKIRKQLELSHPSEMRLPLLWIAILHGRINASLAASTGVHSADDVVQYLLAGADVVMTTSALLEHGVGHMRTLVDGLKQWLAQRDMDDLTRMRGLLAQGNCARPEEYQRANYIDILQGYQSTPAHNGQMPPVRHI
ncbi:dihydroorotate dehydrogenase-like protein [Massilia sp. DWR3-1-1]|uniref:dihydroorotate dehydrogenase-like protein n=1 Tax=Massilia sp. DWR3-1-1 TaxID=2804559 RepID=UPI003CFA3F82